MKIGKIWLAICLIVCASVFGVQPSASGEITAMTIKFSSAKPEIDARGMAVMKFKEIIQKKSNGKIKVNHYLAGALYGERDEAEALSSGAIDLVSFSPYTLLRFDYVFAAGAIPDLFPDWKAWFKFWDDPSGGGAIQKASEKLGMHFFPDWFNTAPYYVSVTRKPVKKIIDFKGMKLRTPVGLEASATAVGASPMAIASAEVITALQTGVVDGISYTNYHLTKGSWLGVTKYCVDYPLKWLGTGGIAANKKWWEKLSPETRNLVAESVKESVIYINDVMQKKDDELRAFMKSSEGYGNGFYDMIKEDPTENAKWASVVSEGFLKQYKDRWPKGYADAIEKVTGKKIR